MCIRTVSENFAVNIDRALLICFRMNKCLKAKEQRRNKIMVVNATQDWKILRPQVQLTEPQIADLTATGVYVAGCTDPAIRSRDDLYDIFVDGA